MFVKKFVWMFAFAACLFLCSADTASACANDRLSHDTHEHVAQAAKSLPQTPGAPAVALHSEPEAATLALKTVNVKPAATTPATTTKPVKAATTVTLQDPFDTGGLEPESGSCIHGCSCRGPKSHRNDCGANRDCHGHEGLLCTWG